MLESNFWKNRRVCVRVELVSWENLCRLSCAPRCEQIYIPPSKSMTWSKGADIARMLDDSTRM
jgi:hypothetical protein